MAGGAAGLPARGPARGGAENGGAAPGALRGEPQSNPGRELGPVPARNSCGILTQVELGSGAEMQPELFADVVKSSEAQLQRSTTDEGAVSQERTSESTWLGYEQSTVLLQLRDFTVQALRIPLPNWETSLQVLRYGPGQFYDAHRDYWDPREFPDAERWTHPRSRTWNMRHATLLWYLQLPAEGGETWFPRAHGGPVPYGEWTACDERGVKMGNGTAAILWLDASTFATLTGSLLLHV